MHTIKKNLKLEVIRMIGVLKYVNAIGFLCSPRCTLHPHPQEVKLAVSQISLKMVLFFPEVGQLLQWSVNPLKALCLKNPKW